MRKGMNRKFHQIFKRMIGVKRKGRKYAICSTKTIKEQKRRRIKCIYG